MMIPAGLRVGSSRWSGMERDFASESEADTEATKSQESGMRTRTRTMAASISRTVCTSSCSVCRFLRLVGPSCTFPLLLMRLGRAMADEHV